MRMTGFTSAINSNANLSGRPSTEHTSAPWSLSFAWPYLIGITKILKNSLVWNSNHPSRAMEVVAALEINTSDIPDSSIVDFHDAALENPRKCRFFWTSGAPDWVQTVGSVAGAPDLTRLRRLGGLGGRVAATCTVQSRLPPPPARLVLALAPTDGRYRPSPSPPLPPRRSAITVWGRAIAIVLGRGQWAEDGELWGFNATERCFQIGAGRCGLIEKIESLNRNEVQGI